MKDPTLEEIIKARDRCAKIIAQYGERYLPIFERLEKEIALRQEKQALMEKALRISGKTGTQNGTQIGTHLTSLFNAQMK